MAVWSIQNFGALFPGLDIAAEHYHPDKLKQLDRLSRKNDVVLSSVAKSTRMLLDPSLQKELPVFDLGAATQHFLDSAQAIEQDRISTKKQAKSGDVLVSRLRSYLKQVATIPAEITSAAVSTEFIVLRSYSDSDVSFLVPFILSDPVQTVLAWSQDGSEHPRFNESVLLELKIPASVLVAKDEINTRMSAAQRASIQARMVLKEAESALFTILGLDRLDLAPDLFYEDTFSHAAAVGRLDAEFFQPKYQRALRALESTKPKRIAPLEEFLALLTNGHTPLHHDLSEGDVSFLTAEHVFDFRIDYDSKKHILREHHDGELKRTRLRKGDCLITIKGRIGNAAIAEDFIGPVNINQDVALFRLKDSLPPYYLMAYLNSQVGKAFTLQYCTGQINPFLGLGNIRLLPIPVYDDPQMQQIAHKTEEIIIKARDARAESIRLLDEAKRIVEAAILEGS